MSTRIRFRVGDSVSGSWVDRAGRRGATAGKVVHVGHGEYVTVAWETGSTERHVKRDFRLPSFGSGSPWTHMHPPTRSRNLSATFGSVFGTVLSSQGSQLGVDNDHKAVLAFRRRVKKAIAKAESEGMYAVDWGKLSNAAYKADDAAGLPAGTLRVEFMDAMKEAERRRAEYMSSALQRAREEDAEAARKHERDYGWMGKHAPRR